MKIREKIKKGYVIALAALMLLPCISLMQAQAVEELDFGAACKLTVSVKFNDDDYKDDFSNMTVTVPVYRVADFVDVTGQKFTPIPAFIDMEKDFQELNDISSVTAETLETLSKKAVEILASNPSIKENGIEDGNVYTAYVNGQQDGIIEGLKPGMYLVAPEPCCNSDNTVQYTFTPYLTILPGAEYTSGGTVNKWNYDDTKIFLKPDAVPLYGKLNIVKYLKNYNATLGDATFVFQIVGRDKTTKEVKYEEMASLTFSAAGTNTITLDKVPVGLDITVTEIYSGASYTIVGDKEQTVVWSDVAGAQEATVSFTNIYDGGNRSGYGVTNHFAADENGGWIWTQNPEASAGE